jgi:hypothetical protein
LSCYFSVEIKATASTSESRPGTFHILTDNAIKCIWDDSSESDSCISTCSEREVDIPVAHTQQKSDLQWDTNLKFEDLEPFENVQGPSHYLPAGCDEKDYFSLFVDRSFFEMVANETNKYAAFSQRKSG